MNDEAVPAIRPIGSIASALKFGIISPKQNSSSASIATKTGSGGWPNARSSARCRTPTARKPIAAACEIRRMPSRITSRLLTKAASASAAAMPPNAAGNQAPRS